MKRCACLSCLTVYKLFDLNEITNHMHAHSQQVLRHTFPNPFG